LRKRTIVTGREEGQASDGTKRVIGELKRDKSSIVVPEQSKCQRKGGMKVYARGRVREKGRVKGAPRHTSMACVGHERQNGSLDACHEVSG